MYPLKCIDYYHHTNIQQLVNNVTKCTFCKIVPIVHSNCMRRVQTGLYIPQLCCVHTQGWYIRLRGDARDQ